MFNFLLTIIGHANPFLIKGRRILFALFLAAAVLSPLGLDAAGPNFNDTTNKPATSRNPVFTGNVGIGTTLMPSGTAIMNGNVGIGTWSPIYKLQVIGSLDATTITQNGAAIGASSGWTDGGTNVYQTATSDFVGIGTTTPAAMLEINQWTAVTPFMVSGGATHGNLLTVHSSGNVGIGTQTPQRMLESAGWSASPGTELVALRLRNMGSAVGDDVAMEFVGAGAASVPPGKISAIAPGGSNLDFAFTTVNGGTAGEKMRIMGGGNVGIGTLAPASKLSVSGGETIGVGFVTTTAPSNGLLVQGNVGIGTATPVAGLSVMNGNVGIGTWSPNNGLEIKGVNAAVISTGGTNANATGPGELYVQGDLEVDGTIYGDGSGITGASGITAAGGWTDGGTNVYTSTTTDNVGIGTTTPNAATLEIVKNAAQQVLKISATATGSGDYLTVLSSGKVGIGTTAPSLAVLEIRAATTTKALATNPSLRFSSGGTTSVMDLGMISGSSVNTGYIQATSISGSGSQGLVLQPYSPGSANVGIGTFQAVNDLSVNGNASVGNGYQMVIGPTDGLIVKGNIGVGTTLPGGGLEIVKPANVSPLLVSSAATADGDYFMIGSTGNMGVGTTTPVGGLAVMNGNVGIGTWSPRSGIEVGGAGTIDNATGVNDVYVKGKVEADGGFFGDGSGLTNVANTAGWTDGGTNVYTSATTDNVGIGTTTPSSTVEIVKTSAGTAPLMVSTVATADGDFFEIDSSGAVGIGTTLAPPTTGLAVMNGAIGIGTWTPGATLDMVGATAAGRPNAIYLHNPNVGFTIGLESSGGGTLFTGTAGNSAALGTNNQTPLQFASNNIVRAALLADGSFGMGTTKPVGGTMLMNGNVGIGTWSSPGDSLYIADGNIGIGTYLAYRRIAGPNNGMVMEGNLGVGTWNPTTKVQVVGTVTATAFAGDGSALTNISGGWTDGGTNVYTSATTDNVGIGTTTPSTTFEIVKQSANTLMMVSSVPTGDGDFFMIDSRGGVGIGTTRTSPSTGLAIMNGNVGIGTWSPTSRFQVAGSGDSYFTGNVGVGTATPSTNLHVQGNARITGLVSCDTIDTDANGNLVCGTDTGGGATGWTDGGTNVYTSTTTDNVGIGTTTPTSTLEVVKTAAATAPFMVSRTATSDGDVLIVGSSGSVGIGTTLAPPTTALTIFGGNVGIGTWNARNELDVAGNIGIGTTNALYFGTTKMMWLPGGTSSENLIIGKVAGNINSSGNQNTGVGYAALAALSGGAANSAFGDGSLTAVNAGGTNSAFGYLALSSVTGGNNNVAVGALSGRAITSTGQNTFIGYQAGAVNITSDGLTDATAIGANANVTASNALILGGAAGGSDAVNVGIGTPNPQATLSVVKNGTSMFMLSSAATSNGDYMLVGSDGRVGIGTTRTASGAGLSIMNGNVGIGTWSPTAILQIKGLNCSSNANGGALTTDANGNVACSDDDSGAAGTSGWTDGGPNVYTSTTTDNVGIGTTTPNAATLEIVKNAGQPLLKLSSAATSSGDMLVVNSAGSMGLGTTLMPSTAGVAMVNGNVGIGTWSPNALLHVMNGNVGIGTSRTFAALDLRGGFHISNAGATSVVWESTSAYTEFGLYSNQNNGRRWYLGTGYVGAGDVGNFYIQNFSAPGGPVQFVVSGNSGNVGIGTTAPVAGLTVMNGNVGIGTWSVDDVSGALITAAAAGNVGIGTIRPGVRLDVNGTVRATAFVGDGSGLTGISGGSSGWTDGGTNVYTSTTTDNVGIGTTTPNAATLEIVKNAAQPSLKISSAATSSGDVLIINSGGSVGIGTIFAAPPTKLTVFGGNVGIGTWNARANLNVYGSSTGENVMRLENSSGNILTVSGTGPITYGPPISTNLLNLIDFGNNQSVISNNSTLLLLNPSSVDATSYAFRVLVGTSNKFVIDGQGNVGLGTIKPVSRLAVNGGVGIGTLNTSSFINTSAPDGGLLVETNIGIGTVTPVGALTVMNGNVGIGTWNLSGVSGALIVASGAGNVGIGTIRPGAALDVNGTVRATAFVGDGSGLTGISGGSSGWTDGGTNVYTSTTTDNVGIGTTTPTGTLEVVKTAAGTAPLMVSSVATADGDYLLMGSDGRVGIGTILTSSGTGVSIMNGNVGIGTWNPQVAFQIGPNNNTGNQRMYVANYTNSGFPQYLGNWPSPGAWGLGPATGNGDATLQLGAVSSSTSPGNGWASTVKVNLGISNGNLGVGTTLVQNAGLAVMSGNVGIGTWNPTGGLVVMNGNVGIGTIKPFGSLHLATNAETFLTIQSATDNAAENPVIFTQRSRGTMTSPTSVVDSDTLFEIYAMGHNGSQFNPLAILTAEVDGSNTGSRWRFRTGGEANALMIKNSGSVGIGTDMTGASGRLVVTGGGVGIGTILTSPNTGLSIMSGNVGIGTWNPASILQVKGLNCSSNANGGALTADSNGNIACSDDDSGAAGTSGWTDGGTNVYTSTTTDNVGIGTTTPSTTLEIVKQGSQAPLMISSAPTADGNLLLLNSAGNLGIGTLHPQEVLDGFEATGPAFIKIQSGDGDAVGFKFVRGSNTDSSNDYNIISNIGILMFQRSLNTTNITYPLAFDGWSNVGIGTFEPSAALEVIRNTNTPGIPHFMLSSTVTSDGDIMLVTSQGGVGIGTAGVTHTVGLAVMSGNVGIGTWDTSGISGALIVANGSTANVGIGTIRPGVKLDVNGTVRATAFVGDGSGLTGISGGNAGWTDGGANVYTSTTTDNVGIGTTTPTGTLEIVKTAAGTAPLMISTTATRDGDLLEIDSSGALGIGTTLASPTTGLSVMNGNVGIGTWSAPGDSLYIADGNIGIGTYLAYRRISAPNNGMVMEGNLGVGTWNPTSQLQVRANTGGGANVLQVTTGTNDTLTVTNNSIFTYNSNGSIGGSDMASFNGFSSSNGQFFAINASSSNSGNIFHVKRSTASYFIVTDGGSIGVGTSLTASAMSVMNGNVGIGTWSSPGDSLYIADGNIGIGTYLAYRRIAGPNNGMVMEGNLGVGTWNPSTKVQVAGTVTATAFVGDGSGLTGISGGSSGWTDGGTNVYTSTTTDNVGIGTTTPTSGTTFEVVKNGASQAPLRISSSSTGNGDYLQIDSRGGVGLGTTKASPTTGLTVMNGNVGIGTWNTSASLTVNGTMAMTGNLLNLGSTSVSPTIIGQNGNSGGTLGIIGGTSATAGILFQSTQGAGTGDYFDFALGSNGNLNGMRIQNASGLVSVGIGTTLASPATGLSIMNGNVGIGTWSSPSDSLYIAQGNIGIGTYLAYRRIAGPNNGMVMEGNLGVGTWNPSTKVQVAGTVTATAFVGDGSGLTGISGGNAGWTDGGANVYTSTTTDNVGIGTTTPTSTLEVVKTAAGTAPFMISRVASSDGDVMIANSGGSVGIGTTLMPPPTGLAVMNGYVGIGTWSPSGPLTVRGGRADTVIELNPWSAGGLNWILASTDNNNAVGGGMFEIQRNQDSTLQPRLAINSSGDLGIGTALTAGGMSIMNGNVGIGTWSSPANSLSIASGNIGIGTYLAYRRISAPNNGMVMEGNLGVGTWNPLSKLFVVNGSATVKEQSLTTAASITADFSRSNQLYVQLNQAGHTINNTNIQNGQAVRLILCQDGSGSRTVTTWQFNGAAGDVVWVGGSAPTLTTTASACDIITFIGTGSKGSNKIFGSATKNY